MAEEVEDSGEEMAEEVEDDKAEQAYAPPWGHFSVSVGDKLYVWGGVERPGDKAPSEAGDEEGESARVLHSYDFFVESWDVQECGGKVPPGLSHGACTYAEADGCIYQYGGLDEQEKRRGCLHRLNLKTWLWEVCSNSKGGPVGLWSHCKMVAYGRKLALVGGYGLPTDEDGLVDKRESNVQKKEKEKRSEVWANLHNLYVYDLYEGSWSLLSVGGRGPSQAFGFSFTQIADHRVLLFGGVVVPTTKPNAEDILVGNGESMSDSLYVLDLEERYWNKISCKGDVPEGRAVHGAVALTQDKDHPRLLVAGGKGEGNRVLGDVFLLDVNSWEWSQVEHPDDKRYGHCLATFSMGPSFTEVIALGACCKESTNAKSVLTFKLDGGKLEKEEEVAEKRRLANKLIVLRETLKGNVRKAEMRAERELKKMHNTAGFQREPSLYLQWTSSIDFGCV